MKRLAVPFALLVGIVIGITLFGIVGMGFLIPAPVNELEVYCQGAVDLWLLQQGADPFDPAVAVQLEGFDLRCQEDVISGTFAGRASKLGP